MSVDTEDDDPMNMLVRAGFLRGLATKLEGYEREMVLRSSRSLSYAARALASKPDGNSEELDGNS